MKIIIVIIVIVAICPHPTCSAKLCDIKIIIVLIVLVAIGAAIWKIVQARAEENAELNSVAKLPPSVGHVVVQMDANSQAAFFHEYQNRKKSLVVAYVCWLFIGVYYFYFKKPGMNIVLWITCLTPVGWVWWIVDFFRMPSIRRDYNEGVARQALQMLSLGTAFKHVYPQQPPSPPQPTGYQPTGYQPTGYQAPYQQPGPQGAGYPQPTYGQGPYQTPTPSPSPGNVTPPSEFPAFVNPAASPQAPNPAVGSPIMPPPAGIPASWLVDPTGRHQYRYFDGSKWTEHVSDNGQASVDPV
jgi:TM2 domain-containing membrane protein YozV